jgi:hypothetical protein
VFVTACDGHYMGTLLILMGAASPHETSVTSYKISRLDILRYALKQYKKAMQCLSSSVILFINLFVECARSLPNIPARHLLNATQTRYRCASLLSANPV